MCVYICVCVKEREGRQERRMIDNNVIKSSVHDKIMVIVNSVQ